MRNKRKFDFQKGVTLIVLSITIIILLILAGITISALVGENGLLNKSQKAKNDYELSKQKEQDILDSYSSMLIATNDSSQVTISIKDLKQLIKEEASPVGTLISYMGNNAPDGYLVCDGKTYNISEYSNLAEQIKNEFGSYNYYGGDGTITFAIPNLNGKFLKGSSSAGVSENAGLSNITGSFYAYSYATGRHYGAFSSTLSNSDCIARGSTRDHNYMLYDIDASRSSSIYGNSNTVTPENMSVLYCIKY